MLYLVESRQVDNSSQIYEFHRNENGKEVKVIKDFKPYFFVDNDAPVERLEGVLSTIPGFRSIDDTPVKKVIVQQSILVKPLRIKVEEMGYKHWEADVLFHNRYTIDLPKDIEAGKLKVCWFDIETDTDKAMPNLETADQAICCMSVKIDGVMTTWLLGHNLPNVRNFKDEEDMLNDFLDFMHKESPDLISAWNLDGFDIPYFLRRCKRLDINFRRLSKTMDVWEKTWKGKKSYKIYGTVQLDLLVAYRLWRKYGNLPKLGSYSLDFVARNILNDKKLELTETIHELWKNNPEKLVEYNQHDVELLDKLDKQCKIVDFFDEIRRKCHIQFEDVYRTTLMIDGILMHRLNKEVVLPTGTYRDKDKFEGAFVFEPKPGLHKNIICEDIASMYPSIIKNFNISYETVGGGDIILPLDPPISFSKKPGIIPRYLDELKKERDEYKKLRNEHPEKSPQWQLYDQRQFGTKIIMNSFFGYLGFIGSRLYKKPVAAAITGMGKKLLLKIAEWVEEKGNKVIYGDTDSVYITSTHDDKYKIVLEGAEIMEHINKKIEEYVLTIVDNNNIFIEFEEVKKRILFTGAKKGYAYTVLWNSDNKFDVPNDISIKGFSSKRSDSNEVSKMVQKHVLKMMMEDKEKSDVVKYLRTQERKLRRGEFEDWEIGFPKGMTKDLWQYNPPGPIVKGSKFSNDNFGTKFGKGTKPMFVYIKTYKGDIKTIHLNDKDYKLETIAFERYIPKGFSINWDRMSERTFKMTLDKMFVAMDWEWDDLNIMGLDNFM